MVPRNVTKTLAVFCGGLVLAYDTLALLQLELACLYHRWGRRLSCSIWRKQHCSSGKFVLP